MEFCSVDLEMTHLTTPPGVILCAVIKPLGKAPIILRCDEFDYWNEGHRHKDYPLASAIRDVLKRTDVLITWNGIRFDVPFLDSRLLIAGETDATTMVRGNVKHIDLMYQTKFKGLFPNNRLETIARSLGTPHQKLPLDLIVWQTAMLDSGGEGAKALDAIVQHCIADVRVLEDVYMRLKHLVKVVM